MTLLRICASALVSAVLVVVPLAPAFAHNYPVSTTPVSDSTVSVQPDIITLVTNDVLINVPTSNVLSVTDSAGRFYGDGCATLKGVSISTKAQLGAAGDYTVQWRVVSADGHPVSGSWSFHWAPEAGQVLATGAVQQPVCPGSVPLETATPSAASSTSNSSGSSTTLIWFLIAIASMIAAAGIAFAVLTRKRK